MRDTVRRDVEEAVGESAAAAALDSLGLTAELARKDESISQLAARVSDLQVRCEHSRGKRWG